MAESYLVAVNDAGRRIGDSHHNAKLTDHEVDLVLRMYDEGWGYKKLSAKFEVSRALIRGIVKGEKRSQTVAGWKRVHVRG